MIVEDLSKAVAIAAANDVWDMVTSIEEIYTDLNHYSDR